MSSKKSLTIALETAVAGGSLSVWEETAEIDFWTGTAAVSKAEDVLEGLFGLLRKNNFSRCRIELIAVSSDAGSATGSKIGAATAKGLAKALGCRMICVSLWDALAEFILFAQRDQPAPFNIYLPGGKNTVCRREFVGDAPASEILILDEKQFNSDVTAFANTGRRLFFHPSVMRAYPQTADSEGILSDNLEENTAFYIGNKILRCV